MKIELRNIQHYPRLSQETNAYNAVIYIDGKAWANVQNDGHGGCDLVTPLRHTYEGFRARLKEVEEYVAANHPPLDLSDYGGGTVPCSLEHVCGRLLDAHLAGKRLRTLMSGKVFYKRADGKIYTASLRGKKVLTREEVDRIASQVRAKEPDAQILNLLPFDEAVALFVA